MGIADDDGREDEPLITEDSDGDNESVSSVQPLNVAVQQDVRDQEISTGRMMILTIGAIGLQSIWSVVMSNGTPYFIYIGLSPTVISLVWLAGPIAGTTYQPYIGVISDRSRHPWGRRKFFIITGTIGTIFCLLLLRESIDLAIWGATILNYEPRGKEARWGAKAISIIAMSIFNFTIAPLQAALRTFIVEGAPSHQQEQVSAWVCRFIGVGSISGYLLSYNSLPEILPFLGDTQFKALCMYASLALAITVTITCVFIKEKPPPPLEDMASSGHTSVRGPLIQIFVSLKGMSSRVKRTMAVQFCAWYSWFTFLYYITAFIGELYANPILKANPDYNEAERDAVVDRGTRIGSLAMFIYAAVALSSNIILPLILHSPSSGDSEKFGHQLQAFMREPWLASAPRVTITQAWMVSQLLTGTCMVTMPLFTSYRAEIAVVGLMGISWAMTQWIPLAIISADISKQEMLDRETGVAAGDAKGESNIGTVMGIYNGAVSAPQVLAALGCGLIFSLLQAAGIKDQMRWVLGVSGLPAYFAAYLAMGL
ncbi:general alpha-glucoside permease [Phlyctema vagabunda]|uniref:General alpha-glucoside permease n=1 Tax=Phlyctema vagabunda TaxID=108571 RepID=A0ABR4PCI1_9HELO